MRLLSARSKMTCHFPLCFATQKCQVINGRVLRMLVAFAVLAGCTPPPPGGGQPTPAPAVTNTPSTDIEAALNQHQDELMRLPSVVGWALGRTRRRGSPSS